MSNPLTAGTAISDNVLGNTGFDSTLTSLKSVVNVNKVACSAFKVIDWASENVLGFDLALQASIAANVCASMQSINEDEKKYSLALFKNMSALEDSALEPGMSAESFQFLSDIREKSSKNIFYPALETALSAQLNDLIKASTLRAIGLLSTSAEPSAVNLLLGYLNSESPSQAAAAALSLGDVADQFSVPAMNAAKASIRWPSARKELERSIADITRP